VCVFVYDIYYILIQTRVCVCVYVCVCGCVWVYDIYYTLIQTHTHTRDAGRTGSARRDERQSQPPHGGLSLRHALPLHPCHYVGCRRETPPPTCYRESKQCSSMHTQNSTTDVRNVGQNEFEKDYRTVS
jgi:hypothetical protein